MKKNAAFKSTSITPVNYHPQIGMTWLHRSISFHPFRAFHVFRGMTTWSDQALKLSAYLRSSKQAR